MLLAKFLALTRPRYLSGTRQAVCQDSLSAPQNRLKIKPIRITNITSCLATHLYTEVQRTRHLTLRMETPPDDVPSKWPLQSQVDMLETAVRFLLLLRDSRERREESERREREERERGEERREREERGERREERGERKEERRERREERGEREREFICVFLYDQ